MKKKIITEIICSLIAVLFLYTGLSKLISHEVFRIQLIKHPLLRDYAYIISWLIPLMEIAIVLLIAIPATRLPGLVSFMVVMTGFTGYLIHMVVGYKHLPCSCGGIISRLSWSQHIYLNLVFILLAIIAIRFNSAIIGKGNSMIAKE